MAVAHRDIAELLKIIKLYVEPEKVGPLLAALRSSEAARHNASLRETTFRLLEVWAGDK